MDDALARLYGEVMQYTRGKTTTQIIAELWESMMASETREPMSDEELAAMRERSLLARSDSVDEVMARLRSELAETRASGHTVLVALHGERWANERLRAENAAMREIVRAVTEQVHRDHGYVRDAVLCYNDNSGELECPFCNGSEYSEDRLKARFEHEADCPVTKARTLVQQWQEAETSEREVCE